MTEPRPSLVASDLGGTTVRDRGEVPAAFADALREAGVPFEATEMAAWRGASKREVLDRLLVRQGTPSGRRGRGVEHVFDRFRDLLSERLARAGPLSLPGVGDVFERLRGRGIRVAITTGFDRRIADEILRAVDWTPLVDATVCSDEVAQGRPAPYMIFQAMERCGVHDVRRVAVVGDTRLDLEAGWNAGAEWRIGVLTGAHDRDTLEAGPSTHVLAAVAELPHLWPGP